MPAVPKLIVEAAAVTRSFAILVSLAGGFACEMMLAIDPHLPDYVAANRRAISR